jgi:hypothetical protein
VTCAVKDELNLKGSNSQLRFDAEASPIYDRVVRVEENRYYAQGLIESYRSKWCILVGTCVDLAPGYTFDSSICRWELKQHGNMCRHEWGNLRGEHAMPVTDHGSQKYTSMTTSRWLAGNCRTVG